MTGKISSDKAPQLLEQQKFNKPEDKDVTRKWRGSFIICAILTALMAAVVVYCIVFGLEWLKVGIYLLLVLGFDGYVIARYVKSRVTEPRKFTAAVERIGRKALLSQITAGNAKAFFVAEDYYDDLIVVTSDYIIYSHAFIYPLKDIQSMSFREMDYDDKTISRYAKTPEQEEVLRNAYKAKIVFTDQTNKIVSLSVKRDDLSELLDTLEQRQPEGVFKSMDSEDSDLG